MNRIESDINTLIAGCAKDDREAQKALFKKHYSFSMNICMRYSKSEEEAREIMNDGFMKVFQYIKKFDKTKSFKPWLKRILVNSAIDHFQRNRKYDSEVVLEEGLNESLNDTIIDSITYDEMLEVIRKLPPAYQTVFNLRAIEGYKHEEIAQMLKISVGTSKSNYARAKQKLQKYLNVYFEVNT